MQPGMDRDAVFVRLLRPLRPRSLRSAGAASRISLRGEKKANAGKEKELFHEKAAAAVAQRHLEFEFPRTNGSVVLGKPAESGPALSGARYLILPAPGV